MKNESHRGSGPSTHKGQAGQPRDKDKGRRGAHRRRAQKAPHEQKGLAGGAPDPAAGSSPKRRPPIVIKIGEGHPRYEEGTFDAAALLASVLAAVELRITEGLHSLEGKLASGDDSAEVITQAIRTVGRQTTEAVRAGVVEGMRSRERHLAQLAVIDRAAAQAGALTQLQERIDRELALAGLLRISDASDLSWFNLADGSDMTAHDPSGGDAYELVSPAYVDAETGRAIERGWIRFLPLERAAAPAGKTHGSSSRKHKDRGRPETAAVNSAPPEVEKPGEAGVQDAPAKRIGPTSAQVEPSGTARRQTEVAATQDADVRPVGPSRTAESLAAACSHEPGQAEGAGRSVLETDLYGDRGTARCTPSRTPGSVGGVPVPHRFRTPQLLGDASNEDNQSPGRTS